MPMVVLLGDTLRKGVGRSLVFELVLLATIACSIMFFGGLILKRPLDGLTFMAGAAFDSFSTATTVGATDGDPVTVLPRFPVIRDKGLGGLGYSPEMQTVEVDIVPDLGEFADDVLGSNVVATVGGEGVLVDVDTARRLGVGIGDRVILNALVLGGTATPALSVVGLTRPYSSIRTRGETGLVVVEAESLPADFANSISNLVLPDDAPIVRHYGGRDGLDVTSREGLIQQFLAQLFGQEVLAATLAVFAFAGLLWLATVTRMLRHLLDRLRYPHAVLFSLGVAPRSLQSSLLVSIIAMTFVAIVAGGLVASVLLFPVLFQVSLQPVVVGIVGLALALVTMIPTAVGLARLDGDLQGARLHETLATGNPR